MFKSIQTKTMFFLAALAISLVIIIGYMTAFAMDYSLDTIKSEDMKDKAILASHIVSEEIADGKEPNELMLKQFQSPDISCQTFLINKNGTYIGENTTGLTDPTVNVAPGPFADSEDKVIPYNLNFDGSYSIQEIYKNDKFYLAAIAPLKGSTQWFICTEEAKSDYLQTSTNTKTVLIIGIILIILILWPIGKKISFAIQKPIHKLAIDAERIADGDISNEIQVSEDGELSDIADSFNLMLNKLKSTMQQVLDKSGEAVSMQEIMTYVDETYNNLPTGIISINNIGEITTFNSAAEEITGISAIDILGINANNPTPPQIKKLISELKRCLSRGSLQLKTITDIDDANGDRIPVEYSINIQFDLKGEVIGAICLFRKIEDIHSFEESANRVKTMEALGEIAASMAHEIKNPLTSIRGNTQYMKMMLDESNLHFDELDIIVHETDRLTTMLNRLLNYARPPLPEKEKIQIETIMDYVVNLISKDLADNIIVETVYDNKHPVFIDREMFESLFINLLLNAIQAMPDGGTIKLHTTFDKKRNMVCASVRDNGKGIPQDVSGKIFDPFFTTKDTGTGLGLPIALRTVEAHRGIIEVESIEGEMTEFTIMLQALALEEEEE